MLNYRLKNFILGLTFIKRSHSECRIVSIAYAIYVQSKLPVE